MVTHVRKLLVSAPCNFLKVQTLKKKHLDCLSLRLWEKLKRFGGKPTAFLRLKVPRSPQARGLVNRAYVSLVVRAPYQKVVSAISAATICVLQEPHPKSSSRRVELSRIAIKFQENGLREVLRFPGVAHDTQGRHMNQTMVSLENHRECIRIARLKLAHEDLVIKCAEIGIRHPIVLVARICSYKTHARDWRIGVYHTDVIKITQEIYFVPWDNMTFQAVYRR